MAAIAAKESAKQASTFIAGTLNIVSDLLANVYSDYIQKTYNRVSTIKTFINPQKPIDLVSNFVPLLLTNGSETIDEIELINRIGLSSRIVISGLAGRGKSVLMKYLAVTKYHTPDGRIPLFLELRSLNNVSSKDFLYFMHASYKGKKRLSFEKFKSYLIKGIFLIILDGFDELNPEFRDDVEIQINAFSETYKLSSIIISGRPDERFNSWPQFETYSICPMTIDQVEDLVNKIDFDLDTKKKFLKEVKSTLYKSHKSFLSTPLLATLMLLTFDQYANIPDKLHIFYDYAFETLFQKHDAMKGQYVRALQSKLPVDVFRRAFSAFCAISYAESRYSFTREEITNLIDKALVYHQKPCQTEQFLFDLIESICLIQLEGFEYSFVHRSFQEYFCALFLTLSDTNTRVKFMDEVSRRPYDNVPIMLFDMRQDILEKEWVSPKVIELLSELDGDREYFEAALAQISRIGVRENDGSYLISYWAMGKFWNNISMIRRLYPAIFHGCGALEAVPTEDDRKDGFLERLMSDIKSKRRLPQWCRNEAGIMEVDLRLAPSYVIEGIQFEDYGRRSLKALREVLKDIQKRSELRSTFLEGLFPA